MFQSLQLFIVVLCMLSCVPLRRFVFGPGIGNALGPNNAAMFAAGAMAVAFLVVLLAVPESFPPKAPPARGGWHAVGA